VKKGQREGVARPEGFEFPTLCFEGKCPIHLSYRRALHLSERL